MKSIQYAAELVSDADAILVVAGAGMGIDSGLPDFRGRRGFWNAYPSLGRRQLGFSDIASPAAFHKHPHIAWGFYGHRLNLYRAAQPHPGFKILRRWMSERPLGGAVFTSNVDGQFQKAGFNDRLLVECHGSLHYLQCLRPSCISSIWSADDFLPDVDIENCVLQNDFPRCPHCGGIARPNVLMFSDADWLEQRTHEQNRRLEYWVNRGERLLVIEIGAGMAISTARDFSYRMAFELHAPIIRINPDESGLAQSPKYISLPIGALQALESIERVLQEAKIEDEGWTQWHGGQCPLSGGTIDVLLKNGHKILCRSPHFIGGNWQHDGGGRDIMAYRVRSDSRENQRDEDTPLPF